VPAARLALSSFNANYTAIEKRLLRRIDLKGLSFILALALVAVAAAVTSHVQHRWKSNLNTSYTAKFSISGFESIRIGDKVRIKNGAGARDSDGMIPGYHSRRTIRSLIPEPVHPRMLYFQCPS
jgi:hypothetical protein